ncbi:MAG: hypothetical protein ACKOPH_05015 [Methylocystis sp.]
MDKFLIFLASFAALLFGFALQADASFPNRLHEDEVPAYSVANKDHLRANVVRGDLYRQMKWTKLPSSEYF